jgi:nitroreductase
MKVMDAVVERRSIRRYKPDEIPPHVLDKLLTAMRLAPSGGNRQLWKFIVVRDENTKASLADACQWGRFLGQAPLVIVACGTEGQAAARYRRDDGDMVVVYGEPVPRACYALWTMKLTNRRAMSMAKATKCSPTSVSDKRS